MRSPTCVVCGAVTGPALEYDMLERHAAVAYKCEACGFLFVDNPTWLEEAYADAIASADTGVLARAHRLAPKLAVLLGVLCDPAESFVDVGAGYGVLVREMRDLGFEFLWQDPYAPNLLAPRFEYDGRSCAAAVAVEVIEHVPNPLHFLEEVRRSTEARIIVVTTELLPSPIPDQTWWYLSPETGQHISFFERRTLDVLAHTLSWHVQSRGGFHVFSRDPIPRALFLVAGSRLARIAAPLATRRRHSLTDRDNPLYRGGWA